jgi:8-oxo-dGTP diphosphatase
MADSGRSEYRDKLSTKKSPYTLLVVAVALIDTKGRVLLAERPMEKHLEGLYEFPGGKVEAWESPEAALVRELDEELGIRVKAEDLVPITFASHAYQDKGFHLLMPVYGELLELFFLCIRSYCIVGVLLLLLLLL